MDNCCDYLGLLVPWFQFLFISRIKDLRDGLSTALDNLKKAASAAKDAIGGSDTAKLGAVETNAGLLKTAVDAITVEETIGNLGDVKEKAGALATKIGLVNTDDIKRQLTGDDNKKKKKEALKSALNDVAYKSGELAAALKLSKYLTNKTDAEGAADALGGSDSVKSKAKTKVNEIQPGGNSGGGVGVSPKDVWSPLLLFPVGSFAEDFTCPGILPFAFLDPEKASIVNYAMPVFFFMGFLATYDMYIIV